MQSRIRRVLKQALPPPVQALFLRMREAVAPPPIDDVVLTDFAVTQDAAATPRITLVLPMVHKGTDFGGTGTGIAIFARLAMALRASAAIDVRVIITDVTAQTDPAIVLTRASEAGLSIAAEQIQLVRSPEATIAVRAREVFITYNWWTTLNFSAVRQAQARLFGQPAMPLIWLMQDYEPLFYPFSSAHMLARSAYDSCAPLWGIINSSNLANYLAAAGHQPERVFIFEPVINGALRPHLAKVASSARSKRIVAYGRPAIVRNCFPALVRGLRRWAADFPEFAEWEVVSAGMPHDPVDLPDGRIMRSAGKLSLDDYADLLLGSSVGVSLMASPHPSYPPLEMAHFGLRTVTNSYFCKDWSGFHPGIIAINSVADTVLAKALAQACRAAGEGVLSCGNAAYLRDDEYPFMDDLRQAILPLL